MFSFFVLTVNIHTFVGSTVAPSSYDRLRTFSLVKRRGVCTCDENVNALKQQHDKYLHRHGIKNPQFTIVRDNRDAVVPIFGSNRVALMRCA